MLCSRAANIGMLLGLDCNKYLLKPLDRLNGTHISTPPEASNLTLNASQLSNLLSVVGTIGPKQTAAPMSDNRTFKTNLKPEQGLFSFFTEPSSQDIESIKHQYHNPLVETFQKIDVPALPSPENETTSAMVQYNANFPPLPSQSNSSNTEEIKTQIYRNSTSCHTRNKTLLRQSKFSSYISLFFLLAVSKGKTFPSPDGGVLLEDCLPNPLFSLIARKNYRNKLVCHTMMTMGFLSSG